MTKSSFYTDGNSYEEAVVVDNDTTPPQGNSKAPSSFYPNGTAYEALHDSDSVLADMTALKVATEAAAAAGAINADHAQDSADASAASAAAALVSETHAATSETNAATSATSSANSATASAGSASTASTQAGIATTKAAQAATSATNAATSEANALTYKNAASTSATNAATSETNALASKNAAATSATNAATSETNALASKNAAATSATNAATSETNALASKNAAATSATNAGTSETNALASKNAAATSATNASTSATNAATSETNALNSLKSFRDVYYGALASNPSLDPDGNACNAGDFYWNTTAGELRVFNGTTWNAYSSSGGAPTTSDYLVKTADAGLSAERVVTDSAAVTWDWATTGAVKARVAQADFSGMTNGTFVCSAASGALTVSIKTLLGNDPSADDPVYFYFRKTTLSSGSFDRIAVTAALSLVLGSGATLAAVNGQGLRIWITAHNDAGTVRLGAINCSPGGTSVFQPFEGLTYTTSVPGNSGRTFYTTTAITTAAPWRLLGYVEWSALTTAGTWTAPNFVQMFGPGIKKPGDIVDVVVGSYGAQNSTTSSSYVASSLTASISLKSAANIVRASWSTILVIGNPGEICTAGLYRDGVTAVGSGSQYSTSASGFNYSTAGGMGYDKPNKTTAAVYTAYFHNSSGANAVYFGNGLGATLELQELMG